MKPIVFLHIVSSILFLTACNMTTTMEIPKVSTKDVPNIEAPLNKQASFALTKVIANIKRGTTIAHFPAGGVEGADGYLCNHKHDGESTIDWGAGSSVLGNWSSELGEIFHETLTKKGLNVAGDPKDLFGRKEAVGSAEYLIGARITEIRGNFCEAHHWWDGRPLRKFSGEMYISVEWTIFSSLLQKEIMRTTTEGYYLQKNSSRNGVVLTFHNAFATAAENIVGSDNFIKITTGEFQEKSHAINDPKLSIKKQTEFDSPLAKNIENILSSVVTIRIGSGIGSGFIIADNGILLTNQHVIGNSKKATVILNNGLELEGKVIRSNKQRDIALIKVPLRVPSVLPIRAVETKVPEKVFAIGTPLKESFKSTVTSGIVSALRKDKRSGLKFIQADVAISAGNSGGPLLDMNGNVLGISVQKIISTRSESLNLFIPIKDALNALNVIQIR